jgi:hypothetical protein
MLIMPLPLLFRLNTTWRAKAGIIFMFSLGVFDLVTSCVRLRSIVSFGDSVNPSWDYTDTVSLRARYLFSFSVTDVP